MPEKPMNADIARALKALKPLSEKKDLPTHFRHKLAVLERGLEILGIELGRREAGAAKARAGAVDHPGLEGQHGNQTA
jgi:hypothetical protein